MRPRFTNEELRAFQQVKVEEALKGEGLYVFRNNTSGDFKLPRPTKSGQTEVAFGKTFQGDSYYLKLVPRQLRLVKVIEEPKKESTEVDATYTITEEVKMEEKLILDQPSTVTNKGTVEQVVAKPETKLSEAKNNEPPVDTLLTDAADGFTIVED